MQFFPTLKQSLTSTQFYTQLRLVPFRESVVFWVKFHCLLLILLLIPAVLSRVLVDRALRQYYPENLQIIYSDGSIQTQGVSLPYTLHLSDTRIVFKDTKIALQTSDIEVPYSYREILGDTQPFTITKHNAAEMIPYTLPIILGVAAVFTVLFLAILRIPIILLYAFVVRSVLNLLGKKTGYMEILQLSLHAAITAEIVRIVYLLLYRSQAFPMFDLAFFGIMLLALRSRRVQIVKIG